MERWDAPSGRKALVQSAFIGSPKMNIISLVTDAWYLSRDAAARDHCCCKANNSGAAASLLI